MRFHNSLRLLMENFKHVYKLLFAKLVIGLIAGALCCSFVLPELMDIWHSEAVQGLVENAKDFGEALLAANAEDLEIYKDAIFEKGGSLSQISALLSSMTLEIVLTVVGCVLVYLVKRYAETVCHFTTGSMLNDKMATYAETRFFAAFVANLGKASMYALVYVPLVFLFDVCMLAIAWGIFSFFPILVALFAVVTEVAVLQAFKLSVVGSWLPGMTADDKKISQAMRREGLEKKQFLKTFSTYLVSVYLIIIINVMAAITTFGSAMLLTVPASFFFLICMQYVNYYTLQGKKYFLTYEQIATNPDHGDSEHYFDYVVEEKTEEKADKE